MCGCCENCPNENIRKSHLNIFTNQVINSSPLICMTSECRDIRWQFYKIIYHSCSIAWSDDKGHGITESIISGQEFYICKRGSQMLYHQIYVFRIDNISYKFDHKLIGEYINITVALKFFLIRWIYNFLQRCRFYLFHKSKQQFSVFTKIKNRKLSHAMKHLDAILLCSKARGNTIANILFTLYWDILSPELRQSENSGSSETQRHAIWLLGGWGLGILKKKNSAALVKAKKKSSR